MAKLKRVLDASEYGALGAAHKENYTAKGDKYVLDVDDAEGLTSSLQAERDRAKALEERLKAFGDLTPEQVTALAADKTKAERAADFASGNFEKMLAQAEEKHAKTLKLRDEGEKRLRSTLESALIGEEATRAIVANKGNPALLLPIIKSRTRLETVGDREVAVVLGDNGGPLLKSGAQKADEFMPLSEFVAGMKTDPNYKGAFESTAGSGTGGQRTATAASQRPGRASVADAERMERTIEALKNGATTISE